MANYRAVRVPVPSRGAVYTSLVIGILLLLGGFVVLVYPEPTTTVNCTVSGNSATCSSSEPIAKAYAVVAGILGLVAGSIAIYDAILKNGLRETYDEQSIAFERGEELDDPFEE